MTGGLSGARYILPRTVNAALAHVFAEPVDGVIVIEHSLYARAHLGMRATTRPTAFCSQSAARNLLQIPNCYCTSTATSFVSGVRGT